MHWRFIVLLIISCCRLWIGIPVGCAENNNASAAFDLLSRIGNTARREGKQKVICKNRRLLLSGRKFTAFKKLNTAHLRLGIPTIGIVKPKIRRLGDMHGSQCRRRGEATQVARKYAD